MATSHGFLDPSRNVQASANQMAVGDCESSSDELVKFFMGQNIPLDVIKDSHFQTLMKTIAQRGQKSCMFLENSSVIEKSLSKFENEIKQYMRMVIASWRTTGCSMMYYSMKGVQPDKSVIGFYCPKGFIFFEANLSKKDVQNASADLISDSSSEVWDDVIQSVLHRNSYHSECQYQGLGLTERWEYFSHGNEIRCIRQQIHDLWLRICEVSNWVQSLIKKSDKIFQCIVTCGMARVVFKALKQKGVEEVAGWKHASSFARLSMIMKAKSELGVWQSQLGTLQKFNLQYDTDVITNINNNDFWTDGRKLVRVLTPFFEIPNLLDTLVPSAGYLGLAMDKASALLKIYSKREPFKFEPILKYFKEWRDNNFEPVQDLLCYFNPSYFFKQDLQEDFTLLDYAQCFYHYGLVDSEQEEELFAELDAYCTKSTNPFADVPMSECEAIHPAMLWSKYGGGFPLLQKCVFKFLNQPACCLCNQVEKHISKLHGSDNFLLRLNALMMEEFTKLGDQIYQPISV